MIYIVKDNKIILHCKTNITRLYRINLETIPSELPPLPPKHKSNIDAALANNVQHNKTKKRQLNIITGTYCVQLYQHGQKLLTINFSKHVQDSQV